MKFISHSNNAVLIIALIFITGFYSFITAQVANDDCRSALRIPSVENYCSGDGEFSNVGAQPDNRFDNTCVSLLWENGVWFSFTPKKPGSLIKVFGDGYGGTMRDPKIVVFESCDKLLECSPGGSRSTDELLLTGLIPGHTYFIMVESSIVGAGSFKLCIDEFVPIPTPESDCRSAVVLCDKSPFKVESLTSAGEVTNELDRNSCLGEEFQSAWYKWTCDESGTLTFILTPNNYTDRNRVTDDLDFALFELPHGIDDCSDKILLRCMASGANGTNGITNPLSDWIDCNGPTGLMLGDPDIEEMAGCQRGNNNFLKELNMESGKTYALIVNNFTREGRGFSIEFGGTGTFLGPKPDFEINANNAFECDKSVIINNTSFSSTDPIVKYSWGFGDRSEPNIGDGQGPFEVTYESFGDKIASLTVETSRGCTVTKIVDFYVEPCCKDTSTLSLNGLVTDLICYDIPEGVIEAQGVSGAPEYSYSFNGGPFDNKSLFTNLPAGQYTLSVQDIKGCVETIQVLIEQPDQVSINAGPDLEIDLGGDTLVRISYFPMNPGDQIVWNPPMEEVGPLTFKATPVVTTTYEVSIIDDNGCVTTDYVTIRVVKNISVHAPNIFSPGKQDGINDFFNVWVSKAAENVDLLEIYDRWGNLVYKGVDGIDFERNSLRSGWDGRVYRGSNNQPGAGTPAAQGVYTWRALVRWKDNTTTDHAGDITVLSPSH